MVSSGKGDDDDDDDEKRQQAIAKRKKARAVRNKGYQYEVLSVPGSWYCTYGWSADGALAIYLHTSIQPYLSYEYIPVMPGRV